MILYNYDTQADYNLLFLHHYWNHWTSYGYHRTAVVTQILEILLCGDAEWKDGRKTNGRKGEKKLIRKRWALSEEGLRTKGSEFNTLKSKLAFPNILKYF